jgi:hypothetical protein
MVKHRGFTLHKFVKAVDEELLQEYIVDRALSLPENVGVASEGFEPWLDSLAEGERQSVLEDFQCINDIAERGKELLEEAKRFCGVETPAEEPRERTAMRLFLHHRDGAFTYAYDTYRYRLVASRLQHYQLPPQPPKFDDTTVQQFRDAMYQFHRAQSKGEGCLVRHLREGEQHVLLLLRGDHVSTELVWKQGAPKTDFFRKAREEVLIYNPHNAILSLKISGRSRELRQQYLRIFCQCFLGMAEVDDTIFSSTTVSLAPIQTGRFHYEGNPQITWVQLVEIVLRRQGATNSVWHIRSDNIRETLRADAANLSLRDGTLLKARLRFKLQYNGYSPKPISVELDANGHTDLPKKREAGIIEQYLRDNGVLLEEHSAALAPAAA